MQLNNDNVLQIVRSFVTERGGPGGTIKMETLLLQEGLIDSFALVDLISDLEKKLGVNLPMGTLIPEDFESPRVLVERLEQI